MCIINYHIYLLKTPLSVWWFNILISNARLLSTHTHLLNDYESEIRVSNQNTTKTRRPGWSRTRAPCEQLPLKRTTVVTKHVHRLKRCGPRFKAPSDWLRWGRTRGAAHQSGRRFLNMVVWEPGVTK